MFLYLSIFWELNEICPLESNDTQLTEITDIWDLSRIPPGYWFMPLLGYTEILFRVARKLMASQFRSWGPAPSTHISILTYFRKPAAPN